MSWASQFAQLGLVPSDPDWLVWKKIAAQLDAFLGQGTASFSGGSSGGGSPQPKGSTNASPSQGTVTTSAASLIAARATRTGVAIKNTDSTNTIYIGLNASVTSSNGYPITPGASEVFTYVGAIFAISGSGSPVAGIWDEYN